MVYRRGSLPEAAGNANGVNRRPSVSRQPGDRRLLNAAPGRSPPTSRRGRSSSPAAASREISARRGGSGAKKSRTPSLLSKNANKLKAANAPIVTSGRKAAAWQGRGGRAGSRATALPSKQPQRAAFRIAQLSPTPLAAAAMMLGSPSSAYSHQPQPAPTPSPALGIAGLTEEEDLLLRGVRPGSSTAMWYLYLRDRAAMLQQQYLYQLEQAGVAPMSSAHIAAACSVPLDLPDAVLDGSADAAMHDTTSLSSHTSLHQQQHQHSYYQSSTRGMIPPSKDLTQAYFSLVKMSSPDSSGINSGNGNRRRGGGQSTISTNHPTENHGGRDVDPKDTTSNHTHNPTREYHSSEHSSARRADEPRRASGGTGTANRRGGSSGGKDVGDVMLYVVPNEDWVDDDDVDTYQNCAPSSDRNEKEGKKPVLKRPFTPPERVLELSAMSSIGGGEEGDVNDDERRGISPLLRGSAAGGRSPRVVEVLNPSDEQSTNAAGNIPAVPHHSQHSSLLHYPQLAQPSPQQQQQRSLNYHLTALGDTSNMSTRTDDDRLRSLKIMMNQNGMNASATGIYNEGTFSGGGAAAAADARQKQRTEKFSSEAATVLAGIQKRVSLESGERWRNRRVPSHGRKSSRGSSTRTPLTPAVVNTSTPPRSVKDWPALPSAQAHQDLPQQERASASSPSLAPSSRVVVISLGPVVPIAQREANDMWERASSAPYEVGKGRRRLPPLHSGDE